MKGGVRRRRENNVFVNADKDGVSECGSLTYCIVDLLPLPPTLLYHVSEIEESEMEPLRDLFPFLAAEPDL